MIAHAIINIPMTPGWQVAMLILFVLGLLISFRAATRAIKQVFQHAAPGSCVLLALVCTLYVVTSQRIAFLTTIAVVLLIVAVALEWMERRRRTSATT
jgi:hypothetical protein